jgi:hypothetical protein
MLGCIGQLQKDKGYAAAIETERSQMASSRTTKRFFRLFGWCFDENNFTTFNDLNIAFIAAGKINDAVK